MDNTFTDESQESVADLFQQIDGSVFVEFLFLVQEVLEVPVTQFLNDIIVVGTLHHVIQGDYVFGLDCLQNLNL